jgi:hypothetical protein
MRVRIYKPAKSAAQSGRAKNQYWLLEPELLTPRMPEPLMGWLSSGDTLIELKGKLQFNAPEEAIAFAVQKGWDYILEPHAERRISPRNYLDNFRITRPQDEGKTQ